MLLRASTLHLDRVYCPLLSKTFSLHRTAKYLTVNIEAAFQQHTVDIQDKKRSAVISLKSVQHLNTE